MDEQLKDVESGHTNTANDHKPPIDPLRRVFVPIERKMSNGVAVFRTSDNRTYVRQPHSDIIRRAVPKIRGKAARRADKLARHMTRMRQAQS